MHDLQDPINQVNRELAESNELLGKQCNFCLRALPYNFYNKDSSSKDGRTDICDSCRTLPRLSLAEHTARLREMNFNSEAVKAQRAIYQEDYKNDAARIGHPMEASELIIKLFKIVPGLYITQGNMEGWFALYKIFPCSQSSLEGRDYQYLFAIPQGLLPEFSIMEFDEVRDILIREKMRGWRTVLLKLIRADLLTEDKCNAIFGRPNGPASNVWYRSLYTYRNGKTL